MATQPLILFTATDANGANGLWSSDGTAAGTSEVEVLSSSSDGRAPGTLQLASFHPMQYPLMMETGLVSNVFYNGALLFTATDTQGSFGLWASDEPRLAHPK